MLGNLWEWERNWWAWASLCHWVETKETRGFTAAVAVGASDGPLVCQFGPGARTAPGFAAVRGVDSLGCKWGLELLSLLGFPFPRLWQRELDILELFVFPLSVPFGASRLQSSPEPQSGTWEIQKNSETSAHCCFSSLRFLASLPSFPQLSEFFYHCLLDSFQGIELYLQKWNRER